jgi:Lon protease-like protein
MLAYNTTIPLFPLNVVLFPGMMLPLHIFEQRYQAMTKSCVDNGEPFGVVLVKATPADTPGITGDYLDELYPVGTTALIMAVEHLDDGRMNLITIGQDRFIIKNVHAGPDNLLLGRVDPYPIQDEDLPQTTHWLKKLRPMVQRYINRLADVAGQDLVEASLPTDPAALAFLAGTAAQMPLSDKQKLLAETSLKGLITHTVSMLEREDKILTYMLKAYQMHRQAQQLLFVDYCLN